MVACHIFPFCYQSKACICPIQGIIFILDPYNIRRILFFRVILDTHFRTVCKEGICFTPRSFF